MDLRFPRPQRDLEPLFNSDETNKHLANIAMKCNDTNQVVFGDSLYMSSHRLILFLRKWLQVWLVQRSRVAHPTVSHTVPMGRGSFAHLQWYQTRLQGWHVGFPGEFHDSQSPKINSFGLTSSLLASWSLQNLTAVFQEGGSEIRLKFMVRCLWPPAQFSTTCEYVIVIDLSCSISKTSQHWCTWYRAPIIPALVFATAWHVISVNIWGKTKCNLHTNIKT